MPLKPQNGETFDPPTDDDFKVAWSAVRCIETGMLMRTSSASELARVVYAAERARKLLAGIPTCAERDQK